MGFLVWRQQWENVTSWAETVSDDLVTESVWMGLEDMPGHYAPVVRSHAATR